MGKVQPHEIKNVKRLRRHLGECTVLLKKDGLFPLEKPGTGASCSSLTPTVPLCGSLRA